MRPAEASVSSAGVKAVVTGGAGFIGSNLVDALVADEGRVLVVDDLRHGSTANLATAFENGAELIELDVRDQEAVAKALAAFRPDVVFHMAAQIDVRTSISEPAHDASVNVVGSASVFSAALAADVRRVVNTSTGGAIYGETEVVPTPETTPPLPLSPYGMSKHTAERYGDWFRRHHGLDVLTLRYGNVYGPRQDPHGDAGVIAIFCDRALSGEAPVVYGDGAQTRDYVFVGDIAAANLAAARADNPAHSVYNVGTGTEVDLLTLAARVAEAASLPPERFVPEHRPARAGEVLRSCLDVTLARNELGFIASTQLVDGLRATFDWIRDR
jgi:UDP-glucose 4-epimerase